MVRRRIKDSEMRKKENGRKKKKPNVYGREVGQMPPTTTYTGNCQYTPAERELDPIPTCV